MMRGMVGCPLILAVLAATTGAAHADLPDDGTVTIGAIYPLTLEQGAYGEDVRLAYQLAVSDFNGYLDERGIGWRLAIQQAAGSSDPTVAANSIAQLHNMGITTVLGPIASNNVRAVIDYATQHKITSISPGSSAPGLAVAGDYVFRLVPDDLTQAAALGRMLSEAEIASVVPIWRGDAYGDGLMQATMSNLEEMGIAVHGGIRYPTTTKTMTSEVDLLSKYVSEAVAVHGAYQVAVLMISFEESITISELAGYYPVLDDIRWFASESVILDFVLSENPVAAAFADRVNMTLAVVDFEHGSSYGHVSSNMYDQLGREPSLLAFTAYDAVWMTGLAVILADSADGSDVGKVFPEAVAGFDGAYRYDSLNEAGDLLPAGHQIVAAVGDRWTQVGTDPVPVEPLQADGIDWSPEELAWLNTNPVVRVGYDKNWPPYEYVSQQGAPAGLTFTFLDEFTRLSGLDFELAGYELFNDLLDDTRAGNVNMVFHLVPTVERSEYMGFVEMNRADPSNLISTVDCYTTVEDPDLKLITITGFYIEEWLDANHPDIDYISVPTLDEALILLDDGGGTAFAQPWHVSNARAQELGITVYNVGTIGDGDASHVGYSKNNTTLGSVLQKIVDAIPDDMIDDWYVDAGIRPAPPAPVLPLTAEECAWRNDNRTISVAYDPGWFPIEYTDEQGNLAGVTALYLEQFESLMGVDFQPVHTYNWSESLQLLQNGTADVSFMMGATPQRQEYLGFTTPHFMLQPSLVTVTSQPITIDDPGLRVLTPTGYFIEDWLDVNKPDLQYTSVPSIRDGLLMLQNSTGDTLAGNWLPILAEAQNLNITIHNSGTTGAVSGLHVAYQRDNPILGSILQKTLDLIPEELIGGWWETPVQ